MSYQMFLLYYSKKFSPGSGSAPGYAFIFKTLDWIRMKWMRIGIPANRVSKDQLNLNVWWLRATLLNLFYLYDKQVIHLIIFDSSHA